MIKYLPKPRRFLVQWHITERCNWHCKHCYQDEDCVKEELSTEQLFDILKQYLNLLRIWGLPSRLAALNITGGEPFVRKDFFKLVEKIGENTDKFHWGILSNGSFVTKEIAKKLKSYKISRYQVSLEGMEGYNDEIRGKGTFKKVMNSIKLLVDEGIRTDVSLTLTKQNIKDIPALVELLDELGVRRLGTRRIIPLGRGSEFSNDLLEPLELRKFYLNVVEMNRELRLKNSQLFIIPGCESSIFNDEHVHPHKNLCGIIEGRLLVINADGDVLPCRRLPIVVGNVLKQSLFEIYYSSDKLWEMRNLNNAHPFCQNCKNFKQCFGGAKCVKYCYANKLFVPDVQCWKFYKKLEKPEFFNRFKEEIKQEVTLHDALKTEQLPDKLFEDRNDKKINYLPTEVIKLDVSTDFEKAFNTLPKNKEVALRFCLKEEDLKKTNREKILDFLKRLNSENVQFKISRPLPRCLFDARHYHLIRKFKMPLNCYECEELFTVDDGKIKSCNFINKEGPKTCYMSNKKQIAEFFKTLKSAKPAEKCEACLHFKRGLCNGLC